MPIFLCSCKGCTGSHQGDFVTMCTWKGDMMSGVWFALNVMFHRLQMFLFRESTAAETPLAAWTRGLKHSQNRGLQLSRASSTLQAVRTCCEAARR